MSRRPEQLESSGSDDESADERLDPYRYQQLQDQFGIRLLRLRPGGKKSAELECELYEESLEARPEYEALSWSWGGESWDQDIRIHHNGIVYKFPVPVTLVAALRALRLKRQN